MLPSCYDNAETTFILALGKVNTDAYFSIYKYGSLCVCVCVLNRLRSWRCYHDMTYF